MVHLRDLRVCIILVAAVGLLIFNLNMLASITERKVIELNLVSRLGYSLE